uniref:Uncharacterized protein n=1 Tax=Anguilla anguilla TaxID=7936 RepID=A0A0E9X7H2_ANGAN
MYLAFYNTWNIPNYAALTVEVLTLPPHSSCVDESIHYFHWITFSELLFSISFILPKLCISIHKRIRVYGVAAKPRSKCSALIFRFLNKKYFLLLESTVYPLAIVLNNIA